MKEKIVELLLSTKRKGIEDLIQFMDVQGFFNAPCSGGHHLCREGGLAEHSLNVYEIADKMASVFADYLKDNVILKDNIIIVSLLHDLGKMGDYGKANYVPNYVNSKTKNKETGEYDKVLSTAKPYTINKELLEIEHEVRSIAIAERFITLTEEEERAILLHNGLYGAFGYQLRSASQTPLELILHWADMWASRVVEV